MNSSDDKSMRELIGQWKIGASLPPRFQERVWRRIEQAAETTTVWGLWQQWLESVFARKTVALAYVTVLMAAGLTAGYYNGHAHEQQWNAELSSRYVQSIDPYRKTGY